ncbi:MAG: transglycosylase SLT domain-containing protein [Prevotella sp.]|nr:transglycosylase SLT domain-containing protein [Prevotella sp.]
MKKIVSIITSVLLFAPLASHAQIDENTITYDEDEVVLFTNDEGEQEQIELPESMTYDLDSLLYDYHQRTYLAVDSTCDLPNVNPEYTDEEIIARLKRLPTIIEMPFNKVVKQFIDKYSEGRLRRTISLMLGAENFFMPIFEEALESYGLPLELKYLPIVESALNPRAVSRAGATGLWQFMLTTGKNYGLEVNSLVDERCDPVLSTYAAAHYLSDLYHIFGDWNLVIAAYNCGPENIKKAIHRANGERDYWQIYPYLPRETRGYVPSFIAVNYMMNYYCDHNICPIRATLPEKTDTIMLDRDVHMEQISHVLGIDIDQVVELNPQYRQNIVNGNSKLSALRLPTKYIDAFIDNADSIYAYNASELLSRRHIVEVRDEAPAPRTYTRSYTSNRSYSSRHSSRHSSSSKSSKKSSRKSSKSKSKDVTVRKGDTLSSIAKRNGTTVNNLKKLNKMKGTTIKKGNKIRVK